jgi:tetratricopeptide (TPR) repeat protein
MEETAKEKFQEGIDLQERGLIDHAVEAYEQALNIEPENIDILVNLGAACLQKGLGDRAIRVLTKALEQKPDNSMALYNIGKAYLYYDDFKSALAAFERAGELLEDDLDVKVSVAQCQKGLGNLEEAADILLSVIEEISSDLIPLMSLGNILLELNRPKEALAAFRKASAAACDSTLPLMGIYQSQLNLEMKDKALTTLRRAIMMEPNNQEFLILLIDLLIEDGKIAEATDALKDGLESIPDPTLLQDKFEELARRLPVLKKREESAALIKKHSPYETEVYDILDGLYDGKFSFDVAIKELRFLREKDPEDIFIAEELANLLFQARKFDAAAELYSEIFVNAPKVPSYRVDLAKSLAMKGDSVAARTILKEAVRDLSSLPELTLALTEMDLFDKDFEKAAARLEMILKEYPDEPHALFLYAYTALRLDELQTAEKTFEKLLEKSPNDEEVALWYSRLKIIQSKPEEALEVWGKFNDGIESLVEILCKTELTLATGDGKSIMNHLRRIGDYHPRFIEDHLLFGKAFFFAGDFASAQREYDLVLKHEAKNSEALAMAAMNSLIRNKTAKFRNYWQHAVEYDSLYAVIPAMILRKSFNFAQRERLKSHTKNLIDISVDNEVDRSRLVRLLQAL